MKKEKRNFGVTSGDAIEYKIQAGSEFQNQDANKSLENIKIANTQSYWEAEEPLERMEFVLEFDRTQIYQINLFNLSCEAINIELQFVSRDGSLSQAKSLERIDGKNMLREIPINSEDTYNQMTVILKNKKENLQKLSISYIKIFGRIVDFRQNIQRSNVISQPNFSSQQNNQISQQKQNIFHQRIQQNQNQLLLSPSLQTPNRTQNKSINLSQSIASSELQKNNLLSHRNKGVMDYLSPIGGAIKKVFSAQKEDSFYEQMEKVKQQSLTTYKMEEQKRQNQIKSQADDAILEEIYQIPLDDQSKKINFAIKADDELNFDDMFDLNESMLSEAFKEMESTLQDELSSFGEVYLKEALFNHYRCLRGIIFFITPEIDGLKRKNLIDRAQELGAIHQTDIDQSINLIITSKPELVDLEQMKKNFIPIVKEQFIFECFNKKFPNLKIYEYPY